MLRSCYESYATPKEPERIVYGGPAQCPCSVSHACVLSVMLACMRRACYESYATPRELEMIV
jgi:hypothetical protein